MSLKFELVFLNRWSYFECHKWITNQYVSEFYLSFNPSTNAIVNYVYSAYKLYENPLTILIQMFIKSNLLF